MKNDKTINPILTNGERKPFFKFIKKILKTFIKKPEMKIHEDLDEGSIFICNHVGATVPLKLELHFNRPFKFWGTFEMTYSYKERWRYLAHNYFYKKKHNPHWLAIVKATFAAPFVAMFYKGMQLIPTYEDHRLVNTIKYSINYLAQNKNIVIFPENSSDGYHEVLTEYFAGFLYLAKKFHQKTNRDIKIYNMYYRKHDNILIVDKSYRISDILTDSRSLTEIANEFKDRANNLALTA